MQVYQVRMIKEFEDVYIRFQKLFAFVKSVNNESYNYETPLELLLEQLDIMMRYMRVLEKRFRYEGITEEVPICEILEKAEEMIRETEAERMVK